MEDRKFVTIKDQAYAYLKEDIRSGRYRPGEKLNEADISKEMQISRTPVREALRQLVSDGLAVEAPNKGVFVRELTVKDIAEIYNMRILLENYAIGMLTGPDAAGRETLRSIMRNMDDACSREDLEAYILLDTQLHESYIRLAGDNLLNLVYSRIRNMVDRVRSFCRSPESRFESLEEHRATVEAILAGNLTAAAERNRLHLERSAAEAKTYAEAHFL